MAQFETMERYLRAQMAKERMQPAATRTRIHPFITISRQAGAGGHALARALIEEFSRHEDTELFAGWQVFDRKLCEMVADDPVYTGSLESLLAEEYNRKTDEFFSHFFRSKVHQDVVMGRVFRIVRAVASIGKAIIIGRAGSEATRDMGPGVSIRLVAPEAVRVKGMMDSYGLDEDSARDEARRLDTARARLLKTHFSADIADPARYDAVFNTGQVPIETVARTVVVMLQDEIVRQANTK